jgi:hypothetical protein
MRWTGEPSLRVGDLWDLLTLSAYVWKYGYWESANELTLNKEISFCRLSVTGYSIAYRLTNFGGKSHVSGSADISPPRSCLIRREKDPPHNGICKRKERSPNGTKGSWCSRLGYRLSTLIRTGAAGGATFYSPHRTQRTSGVILMLASNLGSQYFT